MVTFSSFLLKPLQDHCKWSFIKWTFPEDERHLGCDIVSLGKSFLMFRRLLVPSSSGSSIFFFGLLDHEDKHITILHNNRNCSTNITLTSHARIISWSTPLRESQIIKFWMCSVVTVFIATWHMYPLYLWINYCVDCNSPLSIYKFNKTWIPKHRLSSAFDITKFCYDPLIYTSVVHKYVLQFAPTI